MAGRFFADLNGHDYNDPRARGVRFEDGRTHLAYTRATRTTSSSPSPRIPGSPASTTCSPPSSTGWCARSRPRAFCQWLHGYDMSRASARLAARHRWRQRSRAPRCTSRTWISWWCGSARVHSPPRARLERVLRRLARARRSRPRRLHPTLRPVRALPGADRVRWRRGSTAPSNTDGQRPGGVPRPARPACARRARRLGHAAERDALSLERYDPGHVAGGGASRRLRGGCDAPRRELDPYMADLRPGWSIRPGASAGGAAALGAARSRARPQPRALPRPRARGRQ